MNAVFDTNLIIDALNGVPAACATSKPPARAEDRRIESLQMMEWANGKHNI